MEYIIALSLAYIIGSIPFGLLLTQLAGLGDIRQIGSGNIGATNVLRTGNKKLAATTLALDTTKGALAVTILAVFLPVEPLLIGFFAIIGHCFPVWLKFKGGKGVATTLGTLLAATPVTGLLACLTWLAIAFIFRISSLSALGALAIAPVITFFMYGALPAGICFCISALVWYKHKENIVRLLKNEEPKINFSKKAENNAG